MVAYEHVTLVLFQMLAPLYLDGNEECSNNNFSPPTTRVIAPEVAIAYGCANTDLKSGDNRNQHQYRQTNK